MCCYLPNFIRKIVTYILGIVREDQSLGISKSISKSLSSVITHKSGKYFRHKNGQSFIFRGKNRETVKGVDSQMGYILQPFIHTTSEELNIKCL